MIFREGVASGLMDEAMMPLHGQLTGRRLGLLAHLVGNDIREKYPGVFVAQTEGIVLIDGQWARVPYKTQASTTFFVLHDFLNQIGFLEWALARGDEFLFPQLMSLKDPSKEASRRMQRQFLRAGVESGKGEVFHSLRGGGKSRTCVTQRSSLATAACRQATQSATTNTTAMASCR